jgi:hypothetical protein
VSSKRKPKEDSLQDIGQRAFESIAEMVAKLDGEDAEDALQEIHGDPLSVEVRSGWQSLGEPLTAAEYCLLLGTGGPAVRIVGTLNAHNEPDSATLETQDWGTPWTEWRGEDDLNVLLTYAQQFYFGD